MVHEIKHDGFRFIAGKTVRVCGSTADLSRRFPLIVETLERLRSRSCIFDGTLI